MKALFAGIVLSFAAFSANAGGLDCRSGIDHKHPACYNRPVQVQHNPHYHEYRHPQYVQPHRHYNYRPVPPPPPVYYERRGDWVAPLIGGIILGTVINEAVDRNNSRYCEWRIVDRYDDGTLVRKQVCYYDR